MGRVFTGRISLVGRGPARRPHIAHPLFLLADSQLLFWARHGELFLERARERIESPHPRAAYLGSSAGDAPDLFGLFAGAVEGVGIQQCRQIPPAPSPEDLAYLDGAHLVLLGGGDARAGWSSFEASGLRDAVLRCYMRGAVMVGIGAGAVQLGLAAHATLGLVPYAVDVRGELDDWPALRDHVRAHRGTVSGLGIPRGGGLIYHPDHRVEAIRYPVCELAYGDDGVRASLLLPEE